VRVANSQADDGTQLDRVCSGHARSWIGLVSLNAPVRHWEDRSCVRREQYVQASRACAVLGKRLECGTRSD
jgi:hypothetical protein